mgnify:CR=1 FL=1
MFQGQYVLRLFHHANLGAVPGLAGTNMANIRLRDVQTDRAQPGFLLDLEDGLGQGVGCIGGDLAAGCLGGSLLFYLATNTASFLGDAYYAHTLAGWWQAMTIV